ncbi:MAG TPA: hydrogenase maturation nickel metallochaperone HypA, partial [Gammaproteobacteria bacterium]|nr:hydrogenase maturation nickel metallochaperone HypA [Gammaproteobacteria bacterium]
NRSVRVITLRIGELARVDVDELIELFPLVSRGSCAENAQLRVEYEAIEVKCLSCRLQSVVSAGDMSCPHCDCTEIQLVSGTDMTLKALEFA